MNQSNIKFKPNIIIILNILLFLIIMYGLFYKNREGFSNDIKKSLNSIKKITKVVDQIPKEIKNMGKQIEKNVFNKITSIFTKLGNMLNDGLIKPLGDLFIAIGNVFKQIFKILIKIGKKITELPNCIFIFAIKSTFDTLNYLYRKIIPSFVRKNLSFIYKYTFRYIFQFIGWLTGYTAGVKKCYGFNVSNEVRSIGKGFNNATQSFNKNFGKINFSKLV